MKWLSTRLCYSMAVSKQIGFPWLPSAFSFPQTCRRSGKCRCKQIIALKHLHILVLLHLPALAGLPSHGSPPRFISKKERKKKLVRAVLLGELSAWICYASVFARSGCGEWLIFGPSALFAKIFKRTRCCLIGSVRARHAAAAGVSGNSRLRTPWLWVAAAAAAAAGVPAAWP